MYFLNNTKQIIFNMNNISFYLFISDVNYNFLLNNKNVKNHSNNIFLYFVVFENRLFKIIFSLRVTGCP